MGKTEQKPGRHVVYALLRYMEKRMDKAITKYGVSQDEVEQVIKRYDKKRAYFYDTNTNKHWGDKASYDLCIDSGKLGYETTASIIAAIVRASDE